MIRKFGEYTPDVSRALFIAENAVIIGDVVLEEGVSIWYGAVLRGDVGSIRIGRNSNIQDNCVVHTNQDGKVLVGENVLVGHGAILHGCTVGDGSMIGMGSTILEGAQIGRESLVGAGALVTQNIVFPERSLILGSPAKAVRKVTDAEVHKIAYSVNRYLETVSLYQS